MIPQSLSSLVGLVFMVVSLVAGQPVYAGEAGVAKMRTPACVRGDCRPGPGAQMQGLILQTAALSVARSPGNLPAVKQKLRNLPQSRRARLPSWYKRARAAELRGQSSSVQQLRTGPVQPPARTRVRESVKPAASGQSQGRDLVRPERAAVSVTTTSEASRVRSAAGPRPGTRGVRHRRLVQESLDAMNDDLDWDAGGRKPRSASAQSMSDPAATPLGSVNFTSGIKANLSGNYRLVEPVALNSTEELPLGNARDPFRGNLTGTGEHSLQLDLAKDEGGDLSLFGGLEGARVHMTVRDSRLTNTNGSVSLFGGRTEGSHLDLKVHDSTLVARAGNASLVEKMGNGSDFTLAMSRSTLDAQMSGTDTDSSFLVAGPVAHTNGTRTVMRVHDSSNNTVQARALPGAVQNDSSPLVGASLGWGHVDIQGRDNDLCQTNVSNNTVRAVLDGAFSRSQKGRAYASLAGSYEPDRNPNELVEWLVDHALHRLEQWGLHGNRIDAEVRNQTEGVAVASLGLVYEAHQRGKSEDPEPVYQGAARRAGGFKTRQQECINNNVTAGVSPHSNSSMAVTSVAVATDDSSCGYRCRQRCSGGGCVCGGACPPANPSFMQRDVSGNRLDVVGGNPDINSRTLLGSLGREARERCPYREGLRFDGMEVLLFSGGDPDLPLSVPGDAVLQCLSWHWNPTLGRGWLPFGVVDMSAYQFKCPGKPDNPGACIAGEYLERNTTDPAGWKRIHGAWCSVMHEADLFPQSEALSDCQPRKCTGGEICHSPGEQFHSLVPANDQWLLVTRQTWPDGSAGNMTDVDLFRVLSFSSPAVTGNGLQWSRQSGGAGRLYTGGRVVPVGAGPGAVLADGCTLLHFYEKPGAGDSGQPRLRWISFPHYKAGDADFDRRDWPLAQGCRPLLLSQEDDGVNVWVQQEAGSVQRFLLKDIEQKGAKAVAVKSFELKSESNGDARLQALARDQDWLYSLHATGDEGVGAMQEFEIQRWNISNATAIPDPACHHRFNATESGRLVVTGSAVLLVPEGSLPVQQGDEYVGFKPHVPEEGGCLKWLRQPAVHQVHCPSSAINSSQTAQVCTSVADSSLPPSSFGLILPSSTMGAPMTPMTPLQSSSSMGTRITSETPVQSSRSMASSASEIPVAAASSVVALLVPMACGGALVTAACARKWHKHKGEVLPDDSMKLEDVRASSDADEDVGGINVYESVDDKAVAGAEQPREHVPPSLPPSGANPVGESQTLREERSSP